MAWSSASRNPLGFPGPLQWQDRLDQVAALGGRSGRQRAAEHRGAFAHADDAVPGCGRRRVVAGGGRRVVPDAEPQAARLVVDLDGRARPGRVPQRVAERLLHDPVGGQLHTGRQRPLDADDAQVHGQAGAPHGGDEPFEPVHAGLRATFGAAVGAAEHTKEPAHLGQRLAGDGACLGHVVLDGLRQPGDPERRGLGADGDHRHVVGDDVVELPRDPRPLLQQRAAGLLLLLPPPALDHLGLQPPPRPDEVAQGDQDGGEQDRDIGLVERVPAGAGGDVAEEDRGVGDQPDPDQQVQVQPHRHGVGHVQGNEDQGRRPWGAYPARRRHEQRGHRGHHHLQPPRAERRAGRQPERQRDERGLDRDEDLPEPAALEEQLDAQEERPDRRQPQDGRAVATQPAEPPPAGRQRRRLRPHDQLGRGARQALERILERADVGGLAGGAPPRRRLLVRPTGPQPAQREPPRAQRPARPGLLSVPAEPHGWQATCGRPRGRDPAE